MKPTRKLKKKPNASARLILEEVIGLTTKNANGLDSSILSSNCVYLAGCTVVVYNVDSGTQSHLLVSNRMPKPLSCVTISRDGSFVAAGESGHQPAILVWESATLSSVSELRGHQHGVACIDFSPEGKRLVSVGFPHDGYICLWDWRSGMLVTKVKACSSSSAVASVSFSSDAKVIVSAGKKHLKFWTFESSRRQLRNARAGSIAMQGKSFNIDHQKGCSYVAVTSPLRINDHQAHCDNASDFLPIYALTDSGVLHVLHSGSSVSNSVDLKVEKGFAISASNNLVACACNNGVVKLFTLETLKYAGSLQYTKAQNCNKVNKVDCHTKSGEKDFLALSNLPDAIACQFSTSEKLVVVYEDHSVYVWELHDLYKATRCCVLVSHGACIWDIKTLLCENMHDPSLACVARGCAGGVSFATCSADGTIRLWDFASQPVSPDGPTLATDCDFLATESISTTCLVSAQIFERDSVESAVSTQGFRSMAVSSDGKHLAAGDCRGNLHIYNLHTLDYICFQDAHDADILSLSFSLPNNKDVSSEKVSEGYCFLVSGGRDGMIRLYDVKRNFDLIGCVDDHSAAVTSVKLTCNGSRILSCSANKSLVFYDVTVTDNVCKISRCHHQIVSNGSVFDLAIDPHLEIAVTVGEDKRINIFNLGAGKLIKSIKEDGDFGDPIKVTLDPSCSYLACSYSNKYICIYEFFTGEMVAQAVGHSEVISGVIFLPDCKHIVSVAGDGCIFVWKVPARLSLRMLRRIKENSGPLSPTCMAQPLALSQINFHEVDDHLCKTNFEDIYAPEKSNPVSHKLPYQGGTPQEASTFKFSISRLPKWAQAKVSSPEIILTEPEHTTLQKVELNALSPLVGNGGRYVSLFPDIQTPSKHDLEGSNSLHGGSCNNSSSGTNNSHGSTMRSHGFTMDRRWLTIHTVCLDLLNSPEVWDNMKDMKAPVFVTNLSEDPAVEITSNVKQIDVSCRDLSLQTSSPVTVFGLVNSVDRHGVTLAEQTTMKHPGFNCDTADQFGIDDASVCRKVVVCKEMEQLKSGTTESRAQATMDVHASNFQSSENDTINLNFGCLSAKLKNESRKSPARSYSTQFVMQQEHFRAQKELFDAPMGDFGVNMDCGKGTAIFSDPPVQVLDDTNSANMGIKVSSKEECNVEGMKRQTIIMECKEALHNLDATAETALRLFSKLGSNASRQENLRGPGAQFYNEAAEMLPSIVKKVHAIAKLAQFDDIYSGGKAANFSEFEPLLGAFAECLSQRVVEILKKNCSSL